MREFWVCIIVTSIGLHILTKHWVSDEMLHAILLHVGTELSLKIQNLSS